MSTPALTLFYDKTDGQPLLAIYRKFDGYLSGHGTELAELLRPHVTERKPDMTRLAVTFMSSLLGGAYLIPPELGMKEMEDYPYDYLYHVRPGEVEFWEITSDRDRVKTWEKYVALIDKGGLKNVL